MPRSTIANRRARPYDVDLELRAPSAAAVSATTTGTGIAVDVSELDLFEAVVNVGAYSGYSAGSALWTLTVQVSNDDSTYVTAATLTPVGAAIEYNVPLSGTECRRLVGNEVNYIRLVATKTGSPGNVDYFGYLTGRK